MDLGLKGKRALITGSSRGLGFATALGRAADGCGGAVNSRALAPAPEAAGRRRGR